MHRKLALNTVRSLILFVLLTMPGFTACSSPTSQPAPTAEGIVEPTLTPAPSKTMTPAAETPTPPPTETATPEAVATETPATGGSLQFTFEDGLQGWMPRGEASVSVADDVSNSGSHSLLVTNRTANWHGAAVDVSPLLKPGTMYTIGGYVRLAQGAPASRVIITMQRTPAGGDTVYEWIAPSAEKGVTDGAWVHLQGQYSFSGKASELLLYVESPDAALVSFYIDDITIVGQLEVPIQTDIPSVYETLAPYFPVGAAFSPSQLDSERHTALMVRHFNSLTPENTMKPGPIQPSEGNFAWAGADRLVEFARANHMAVHGHTLVWHQQAAEWMFKDAAGNKMTATPENKQLLLKRLEAHIRAVVGRYKDDVNVWDVVNEVIDANRPDCLRRSPWYEITGVDYIVTAFRVAREVDPDAVLLLNDFNTYQAKKRECIYTLVSDLQAQGVPIDGIGMQMHVNIQVPSIDSIEAAIERFAELGEVHITELDMSLYTNDTTSYAVIPDELLLQQGYRYRDIFEVLKRHADVIGSVTFWGIADDNTWLKTFPTTRLNLPLLFDEQLQAKYAYWGVVDPTRLPAETP
ncbi:MAG: endo-1,4-beta-xylanase [Anaerolineae bacterium]